MKKSVLLEFINKHTDAIDKCRWVSNSKDKTLKADVAADSKNLLCNLCLSNWDSFGDVEIGIGDIGKFKRELCGLSGEDLTTVVNYNDDKSRIVNIDFLDGENVGTLTVSDLKMLNPSSKLKNIPQFNAEIIVNKELIENFLRAKTALPDVKTFTIMMNKKNTLEIVVGYSNINSSRFKLAVKTTPTKNKVKDLLHFRADYLKSILTANSEVEETILKVSDEGICSIDFVSGDFNSKYYLTVTDDLD